MNEVHEKIYGSEILKGIYGYWPQFHDAELLSFFLSRGSFGEGNENLEFPSAQAKIHVFEMTSEVSSERYFVLHKHQLVDFLFEGVEDLHLEGFNHQNVLLSLDINILNIDPIEFEVIFDSAFGADAQFSCSKISVVEVIPCDRKGIPCA